MKVSSFVISLLLIVGCSSPYSRHEIPQPPSDSRAANEQYLLQIESLLEEQQTSDLWISKARIESKLGKGNQMLRSLQKATQLSPNSLAVGKQYLAALQESKRLRNAINEAERLYKLAPRDAFLSEQLALLYFENANYEKAFNFAQDNIRNGSNTPENLLVVANVGLQRGDSTGALSYLKSAMDSQPSEEGLLLLATISESKGNEFDADRYIDETLRINPMSAPALSMKGKKLLAAGLADSAFQYFWKSDQLAFNEVNVLALGNYYYGRRLYDSANFFADKLLNADRKNLEAKLIQARVADKRRNYSQSIATYEDILAQDSTFQIAIDELDFLRRKVAYLRRIEQQKLDSVQTNSTDTIN